MSSIINTIRQRRIRRRDYRASIHYAIAHAISQSDRTELLTLASALDVSV